MDFCHLTCADFSNSEIFPRPTSHLVDTFTSKDDLIEVQRPLHISEKQKEELAIVEWFCFIGSAFDVFLPFLIIFSIIPNQFHEQIRTYEFFSCTLLYILRWICLLTIFHFSFFSFRIFSHRSFSLSHFLPPTNSPFFFFPFSGILP